MGLLGVVDVQAVLPLQADLEGDLPDLIQRFPREQPHGIQQIEDRIHPRPTGLDFAGGNLSQAVPGQTAQLLGYLHLQFRLEKLLGQLDVSHLHRSEGADVNGLQS